MPLSQASKSDCTSEAMSIIQNSLAAIKLLADEYQMPVEAVTSTLISNLLSLKDVRTNRFDIAMGDAEMKIWSESQSYIIAAKGRDNTNKSYVSAYGDEYSVQHMIADIIRKYVKNPKYRPVFIERISELAKRG